MNSWFYKNVVIWWNDYHKILHILLYFHIRPKSNNWGDIGGQRWTASEMLHKFTIMSEMSRSPAITIFGVWDADCWKIWRLIANRIFLTYLNNNRTFSDLIFAENWIFSDLIKKIGLLRGPKKLLNFPKKCLKMAMKHFQNPKNF